MTPLAAPPLREAEISVPGTLAAGGSQLLSGERLLRPLEMQIAELEARAITATLRACKGNKLAAAKQLGISRATLYARLELVSNADTMSDI